MGDTIISPTPETVELPHLASGIQPGGRPVVGVIGWGVPIEMIEAFGAIMVRIQPERGRATPYADALVGIGEAQETRLLLEPVLNGSMRHCALIIVTRAHEWLYYFLKEAVRSGADESVDIPPLQLHDFVATTEPALRTYNSQQFSRLETALERRLGVKPSPESWNAAIAAGNSRREALRQLAEMRLAGKVSGADAVRFVAQSARLTTEPLADAFARWRPDQPAPGQPRLLLLSGDDDHDGRIHEAIEDAGAVVVAEDGEWGIRTARADVEATGEPLAALAEDALDSATGPLVSPRERRLGWAFGAMERDDLDAVIFAIPPSDTKFGWDYPVLRDRAASLGLPQFLLKVDALDNPAEATEAVAAFLSATVGETLA